MLALLNRHGSSRWACSALLALAAAIAPASGSAKAKTYKAWNVACPSGQDAICTLQTPAMNGEQEPDTSLRISRTLGGEVRQIVLATSDPVLTKRFPLLLRVDSRKPIRLTYKDGIEIDDLGTLRIYGASEIETLLKQMRPGRRIRLEFYDKDSISRFAIFSLSGLGKALAAADGDGSVQTASQPQPQPQPTPVRKPDPPSDVAAAKPVETVMLEVQPTEEAATETVAMPIPVRRPAELATLVVVKTESRPRRKQTTDLRPPPASLDGALQVSGSNLPAGTVFTPLGELPPESDCYDHQRSTDADGRYLGWISTNYCN